MKRFRISIALGTVAFGGSCAVHAQTVPSGVFRSNAITVEFNDGTKTREVVVEYPIGHRRRRDDGIPLLVEKFRVNVARRFAAKQQQAIFDVALDQKRLAAMAVNEFVDLLV